MTVLEKRSAVICILKDLASNSTIRFLQYLLSARGAACAFTCALFVHHGTVLHTHALEACHNCFALDLVLQCQGLADITDVDSLL